METQSKKVKVIMLPTTEITVGGIVKCVKDPGFLKSDDITPFEIGDLVVNVNTSKGVLNYFTPQHLYFISGDEIKKGDCIYNSVYNKVFQVIVVEDLNIYCKGDIKLINNLNNYKIIATTDGSIGYTDLSVSPVQNFCTYPKPSQAFIEKYCKLGGIDEVVVEYEVATTHSEWMDNGGSPLNRLKTNSYNEIKITSIKDNWSREEMCKLMDDYQIYLFNTKEPGKTFKEWFNINN